MSSIWRLVFYQPIVNILVALYLLLWQNLGLAIIALTVVVRLILLPLTLPGIRSAKKMRDLQPILEKLKKKHKSNRTKLMEAQMALYKEHNLSLTAGCLPLLLQLPVMIALYQVFIRFLSAANGNLDWVNQLMYFDFLHIDPNQAIHTMFLGINLITRPSEVVPSGSYFYLLIPALVGILQYFQAKYTTPMPQSAATAPEPKSSSKDGPPQADFGQSMSKQMMLFAPIMTAFFSYSFPIGLSLYWIVYSLFAIIQQYFFQKE